MAHVDAQAADDLARILYQVLQASSGSSRADASRILAAMEEVGWTLVRLPTATDVVKLPDGTRRADFGTVTLTVDPDGRSHIASRTPHAPLTEEGPIAILAACRWLIAQHLGR